MPNKTFGEVTSGVYPNEITDGPFFQEQYPEVFTIALKYGFVGVVSLAAIALGGLWAGFAFHILTDWPYLSGEVHSGVWLFLSMAGLRIFILSVDGYWFERQARKEIHEQRIAAMQARTDRLKPARVEYKKPYVGKFEMGTYLPVKEESKPPEAFILYLYQLVKEKGRLPGEDWLEANTEWKRAGEYLRTLSEQGFIEGRDGKRKLPGELVGDTDRCVAHFWKDGTTTLS